MTVLATGGGISRFAHLTGGAVSGDSQGNRLSKAKADDGDDKKDKDNAKKAAGDKDGDGDDEDNNEGDVIVDVDVTVEDPKSDDEEEEGEPKSKGKGRAKKASAGAIRRAERARCDAILAHAGAAHNGALAAMPAFSLARKLLKSDLQASVAGGLFAMMPEPAPTRTASGLAARMATVPPITIGADAAAADQPQTKDEEARALASNIVSSARASGVIRK